MTRMEQSPEDISHLSSTDLIQKRMIDAVFQSYDYYCMKDETHSDFTHQTKFFRSVPMIYAMLYKYMPTGMRDAIKQAFDIIREETSKIDASTINDANKQINKRMIEDEYGGQILQLCILALQYSPVNTELKELIMTPDKINFNEIIRKIRSDKPIGIFKETDADAL